PQRERTADSAYWGGKELPTRRTGVGKNCRLGVLGWERTAESGQSSGTPCSGRSAWSSGSTRQVRQKSTPNGVRWIERRTILGNRTECIASSTSGCASTTWYSSGSS